MTDDAGPAPCDTPVPSSLFEQWASSPAINVHVRLRRSLSHISCRRLGSTKGRAMKRLHLLIVVEKTVGRAMRDLVQAHLRNIQGHVARSIEKRLIGVLGSEMLRAMGHQPEMKLRASGEGYKPSHAVRQMRHAPARPAAGITVPQYEFLAAGRTDGPVTKRQMHKLCPACAADHHHSC
jgi:hypothetical protein